MVHQIFLTNFVIFASIVALEVITGETFSPGVINKYLKSDTTFSFVLAVYILLTMLTLPAYLLYAIWSLL
jgi:hypothetical protein